MKIDGARAAAEIAHDGESGRVELIYHIDWEKYLQPERWRESQTTATTGCDRRNQFESDLGRVIFCPAIRRMHDKTQIIPLTSGDTVLTRLTHSLHVMNVAESIAHSYTRTEEFFKEYGEKAYNYDASISAILRTAALIHDIGNPPFGHFGEVTIQKFFKEYFVADKKDLVSNEQALDFTQFDGNALGLRIISKLQYTGTLDGLNLTFPVLGAYLKYPNSGSKIEKGYVGCHKHGVFFSEKDLFDRIIASCNMKKKDDKIMRHPLSFLVEAADTICYNTSDMEDGFNAQWYSFDEIIRILNESIVSSVSKKENGKELLSKHLTERDNLNSFSIEDLIGFNRKWRDGTEKDGRRLIVDLRVSLINYLVKVTLRSFKANLERIDNGEYNNELLKEDEYDVSKALGDFAFKKLISRREVQELELTGNSVINGLLNILLKYAFDGNAKFRSKIKTVIARSRMEETLHEEKYRNVEYRTFSENDFWSFDVENLTNYTKLRLIVDFVASMTDKYSVELYQRFAGMRL